LQISPRPCFRYRAADVPLFREIYFVPIALLSIYYDTILLVLLAGFVKSCQTLGLRATHFIDVPRLSSTLDGRSHFPELEIGAIVERFYLTSCTNESNSI